MHEWIKKALELESGLSVEERKAWSVTLKRYFGYVAKNQIGDPSVRDNGKIFWREAVLTIPDLRDGILRLSAGRCVVTNAPR